MQIQLSDHRSPFHFPTLFGREAPVEVEIGVGKGRFLRERAQAHPELDFIGIEQSAKWLAYAHARLEQAGVQNVRLIQGYAEPLIAGFVPDGSVSAYHIYFPDPWPKRRHNKRRLFQKAFVDELIRTLKPGGAVNFGSDHNEYYNVITDTLIRYSRNYLNVESMPPPPFLTNFQAKYMKEGRLLTFGRAVRL